MAELEIAFGKALRDLRNQKSLSQETLGFEAELARNYVSQLELGSKSPSLRTIFKLCKVLETSPAAMIEDVERRMDAPKKTRATSAG